MSSTSKHDAKDSVIDVQLRPARAFAIAFGFWTIPLGLRYAGGSLTAKQVGYEAVWAAFAIGVSLAVTGLVFRMAMHRGASLTSACALSAAANLPALMVTWLVDFSITNTDPGLSAVGPEHMSLVNAVLISLADSLSVSTFLAAIVFLPVLATAHEQRRHQLETLVREAELAAYRAQLEPHFVLNALNAVAGLVEEDPPQARELLAALGDLFRDATSFQATHRVKDEMAWLERYLTIHQLRFPDMLQVEWDVDPATRELMMPALITQPLVENAVKHGALRGGGRVAVRARLQREALELVVEDNGPGLGKPRPGARGLAIVQRRVDLEGHERGSFSLMRDGDRTVARVRLGLEGR